jgi:hypothetical protein
MMLRGKGLMIAGVPAVPGPVLAEGPCDACGHVDRVEVQRVEGVSMRLCVVTVVCVRRTEEARVVA